MKTLRLLALIILAGLSRAMGAGEAASVPDGFPRFIVPGKEPAMDSLRRLYWLHYQPAGPLIPLWDEWMPMSTLWPAVSPEQQQPMRTRWAQALASRGMSSEGYIHTHQHDGLAHAEGWPFPLWTQAGGIGWHFRGTGIQGYDGPPATPDGWTLAGAASGGINEKGWVLELTDPQASIQSPAFAIDSRIAPWLRLNWWANGLGGANGYIEWTTADAPEFSPERRMYFSPAREENLPRLFMPMGGGGGTLDKVAGETRTMIPVHRLAGWQGTITGLRIQFDNRAPAKLVIKSFHTACDTRHNINNANFIRGCHDYFLWTGDLAFLRDQIGRLRTAMRFLQREFDTRNRRCVYTTWPGHEGRSGIRYVDGKKHIVKGEGIGSNYWDLLPFGGEDALATVYYYDALRDLADLEEQIHRHPEWCVVAGADAFDPADLRQHAGDVRAYGQQRFWNPATGRFGTVDLDGTLHDYGFVFLNNEAVVYGFASPQQAASIHAWIAGTRIVEGDTSTGPDIYHWRFGPRSTTRRNIDYYFWAWSAPESIPWGYQVQDGGAVLGWSYYDLMQRLMCAGPDDAAARLAEILRWFDETQAAGGYRAYYAKDPQRGSLQGGNVPGGLGLDREFFESILVPQVMLYGFMGFQPRPDGFAIHPRLPKDWPELTITQIALHRHVLDLNATREGTVTVSGTGPTNATLAVEAPPGVRVAVAGGIAVRPDGVAD
ncbi:MAG TPA: hypothetical protein PKM73_14345 [Verrucomicrobiota bacterium]|nr:hypothetical protein [Verrucomicrobiota bacterium]HNU53194.1 hypothetical protein [Verrucomicrobiota bacterium]